MDASESITPTEPIEYKWPRYSRRIQSKSEPFQPSSDEPNHDEAPALPRCINDQLEQDGLQEDLSSLPSNSDPNPRRVSAPLQKFETGPIPCEGSPSDTEEMNNAAQTTNESSVDDASAIKGVGARATDKTGDEIIANPNDQPTNSKDKGENTKLHTTPDVSTPNGSRRTRRDNRRGRTLGHRGRKGTRPPRRGVSA